MAELILNKNNFEQEVLKAEKPVVVDFWAPWCGPCRAMSPVIEKFAEDYREKFVVGKVNVEEQMELAEQYGIMSIPSIKVFKNGEITASNIGYTPADILLSMLNK